MLLLPLSVPPSTVTVLLLALESRTSTEDTVCAPDNNGMNNPGDTGPTYSMRAYAAAVMGVPPFKILAATVGLDDTVNAYDCKNLTWTLAQDGRLVPVNTVSPDNALNHVGQVDRGGQRNRAGPSGTSEREKPSDASERRVRPAPARRYHRPLRPPPMTAPHAPEAAVREGDLERELLRPNGRGIR